MALESPGTGNLVVFVRSPDSVRPGSVIGRLLLAICLTCVPTAAIAQSDPLIRWQSAAEPDFDRGDVEAVRAHLARSPGLGRIWFYGTLADAVSPGLQPVERDRLVARLEAYGSFALSRASHASDGDAYAPGLDGPAGWSVALRRGDVAARIREARGYLEQLGQVADQGRIDIVAAESARRPDLIEATFHLALFRTSHAMRHLGGRTDAARWIRTARWLALAIALIDGRLDPWRSLAAFSGGAVEIPRDGGFMEAEFVVAMNDWAAGREPEARAGIERVRQSLEGARGPSVLTVMISHAVAHIDRSLGDPRRARAARVRVLQAVRPVGIDGLTAAIVALTLRDLAESQNPIDLIPFSEELRRLDPESLGRFGFLRTLDLGARTLERLARAAIARGDLATAMRAHAEVTQVLELLRRPKALDLAAPPDTTDEVLRRLTARLAAEIHSWARATDRAGRWTEARASYVRARRLYADRLGDTPRAAIVDVALAKMALAAGELDDADQRAREAEPVLAETDPIERVHTDEIRGWVHLRRGAHAPAFAFANRGLRRLIATGVADQYPAHRAELHRIAAAALDASGHRRAAAERLAYAIEAEPSAENLRWAAAAWIRLREPKRAVAAFRPGDSPTPAHAVFRGCARLANGSAEAAITDLAAIGTLKGHDTQRLEIVGRTCLADALRRLGKIAEAGRALAPARALVLERPDPALLWRVEAIHGAIETERGAWAEAREAYRNAVHAWQQSPDAIDGVGRTLDRATVAPPVDIERVIRAYPDLLDALAEAEPDRRPIYDVEGLRHARWAAHRAARSLPRPQPGAEIPPPSALQTALGTVDARLSGFDRVLAEPRVSGRARVAAIAASKAACGQMRTLIRKARAEIMAADDDPRTLATAPATSADLTASPDEARLYYAFGERHGHLWVYPPSTSVPVHYRLPGRAALAAILAPARGALEIPPPPFDPNLPFDPLRATWSALWSPVPTLLPFLEDRDVMAAMGETPWRVWTDGPLDGLPFDALVIGPAPEDTPGAPPRFLGAERRIRMTLGPARRSRVQVEQTRIGFAIAGPGSGPQAMGACQPARVEAIARSTTAALASVASNGGPAPSAPERLTDGRLTATGVLEALVRRRVVHLAVPIDAESGDIQLSPGASITPGSLAEMSGAPETLVVSCLSPATRVMGRPPGLGLRRLAAAARIAGARRLVFVDIHDPMARESEVHAELSRRLATTLDATAALREWRAEMASTPAAPGELPVHHPYGWGRWQIYDLSAP